MTFGSESSKQAVFIYTGSLNDLLDEYVTTLRELKTVICSWYSWVSL